MCVVTCAPNAHKLDYWQQRSLLLGGGWGGRFPLPLLKRVLPSPTPQLYRKEKLKQHCLQHTKQLGFQVVFAHSSKGTACPRASADWRSRASVGRLSPRVFLLTVCLHYHRTPGQQLGVCMSRNNLQIHIQGRRVERLIKNSSLYLCPVYIENKTTMKSA